MTFAYADDVTHIVRAKSIKALIKKVQKETDQVTKWERKWLIKTNPLKSQLSFTKTRHTTIQRFPPVAIVDNNNPTPIPTKNLQIYLDTELTKDSMEPNTSTI